LKIRGFPCFASVLIKGRGGVGGRGQEVPTRQNGWRAFLKKINHFGSGGKEVWRGKLRKAEHQRYGR